jgi:hypothetical protein
MWRRGLILTLALNLVALAPVPLSACAILSGLDGPCQCSMMIQSGAMSTAATSSNNSPAMSCHCIQSAAPSPKAVQIVASPTPVLLASSVVSLTTPQQLASRAHFLGATASDLASPGRQARLCVFLI